MSLPYYCHAFADNGNGPLCGDPLPVHISTGPPSCPGCIACQEAAAAAAAELSVLVVIDVADEGRPPGEIADYIRRALEACGERVIHVEDLPYNARILTPGERNGRA